MRPVRFNIHPKEANIANSIMMGELPDGHLGDGFFATKLSDVVGLARKFILLCHLQPVVAVLNLWQQLPAITIWQGSVAKE
jgi:hypothetical protein